VSSKVLCAGYGAISIAALIATWSQNVAYFDDPGRFVLDFFNDSRVIPAARSLTAAILMAIVGGLAIAISVTFPLLLIAQLHMG
jgi:hypothetical protein